MPLANSADRYGPVARALHWATAALIIATFALGLVADALPLAGEGALERKAAAFSLHKTAGVAALALGLLRILWAVTQPRPVPLHPGRRLETRAAEAVHAGLYVALLAVPLTGWVHHAASEGFAPILWPLGQGLPLVPKSETVAHAAGALHFAFVWLLAAAVALHVAGALKHALIDRDATLARMLRGVAAGAAAGAHSARLPLAAAVVAFGAAGAGALALSGAERAEPAAAVQAGAGDWRVLEGAVTFDIRQMGATVQGNLPAFAAEIRFDPALRDGPAGDVRVNFDMGRARVGAVSDQAQGPDYFDTASHPEAVFAATIRAEGEAWLAEGTLTLRGVAVPVALPFTLALEGSRATMQGAVQLDRRAFGMVAGDEGSLGFFVDVNVALTAERNG